ncbi:MAG TPA: CheR family methyltransferase [Geobacteraceae bacterium]|nr:CheR family methyltransferase [Geobacteraceae bacterium]
MPPTKKSSSGKRGKTLADVKAGETTPQAPVTVVVGASAGGLEALEQFFRAMPADPGICFVVLVHHHPDGQPLLAGILSRYTRMDVVTAAEGMALSPNTVCVIPPTYGLILHSGRFTADERAHLCRILHPVDLFFRALGAEAGMRAIAVILSGTGSDGTEGAKAVKDAGGIIVVQDPASAKHTGMPRSAIEAGVADLVLSAAQMPEKIVEIARRSSFSSPLTTPSASLDEELRTIFAIVKAGTGNDFSSYKTNTIMRRIERRMTVNATGQLESYIAFLKDNPQEVQALAREIMIGVTSFFRDPEAFDFMAREVIPALFAGRDTDDPVRIWHAGCSTGEEVYSMAILIQEFLSEHRLATRVQFFATDIDETAIGQARAGLYSDVTLADMDGERLKRFFTRSERVCQVSKQLREMIVFAHHNLIRDPPFSRLDLLICRNFLIYLNPDIQKRLIPLFHQVLKPGGFLFLGSAETVGLHSDLFIPVDKKWKIFTRQEGERRVDALFPFAGPVRKFANAGRSVRQSEAVEPGPVALAERLLLERYLPARVIVNEKNEVVHFSNRTEAYLAMPAGEPTRDLLRLAREELRPALRAAIHKAFTEQKQIDFRRIRVPADGGETAVNIIVAPLQAPPPAGRLALVIFEPAPLPAAIAGQSEEEGVPGDETSRESLIRQLEEQLRVNHEQLQATSEQLETSNEGFMSANEELMSVNEELQSTNEELETSKEELQALNEELLTVNAELQAKVEERNQATSDLENLLTSSEIATIFLDRGLNIKRFTPAIARIFDMIPADIGRPFRRLAGKIDWPTFAQDAAAVLAGRSVVEREVTAHDNGECYLKRVLPYRTAEGKIDGIVVTFIDITERKRAEEEIRLHAEEMRTRNEELTRLNRVMEGRELRMIELKKEVNDLCRENGRPPLYSLDFEKDETF